MNELKMRRVESDASNSPFQPFCWIVLPVAYDRVIGLLNDWTAAAGIKTGSLFRRVSSAGKVWGETVTEKLVWHVVKEFAGKIGVSKLAPHDLRRSCARLCRAAGGELEQIQFLLGHVSVQTTERYLGCTQRIASAVNDRIGIEPKV
jgi:integrase